MISETRGGIDLNPSKMKMGIHKDGEGVDMHVDPAMVGASRPMALMGWSLRSNPLFPLPICRYY